MARLDTTERGKALHDSHSADEGEPQEMTSPVNEEAMKFLRASRDQAVRAEAAARESAKQQEEEFLDCQEELPVVQEESPSQLQSGTSTMESAKDEADSEEVLMEEGVIQDDITRADALASALSEPPVAGDAVGSSEPAASDRGGTFGTRSEPAASGHPSGAKPFELCTDASEGGWGAVLKTPLEEQSTTVGSGSTAETSSAASSWVPGKTAAPVGCREIGEAPD